MKKSITFVMSVNLPYLLIACLSNNASIFFVGTDFIKSVLTGVGPIALTVIFYSANSLESI